MKDIFYYIRTLQSMIENGIKANVDANSLAFHNDIVYLIITGQIALMCIKYVAAIVFTLTPIYVNIVAHNYANVAYIALTFIASMVFCLLYDKDNIMRLSDATKKQEALSTIIQKRLGS